MHALNHFLILQIDQDFLLSYPTHDNFLGIFPSYYAPRILKLAKIEKPAALEKLTYFKDGKFFF